MSLYTSTYTGAQINEGIRRTYEVFAGENLLHNWDFRNPVNQRGASNYSANFAYGIDRWRNIGAITVNSGYITLAGSGSTLYQFVENPSNYVGLMLTFSAITSSGLIFCTATIPNLSSGWQSIVGVTSADGNTRIQMVTEANGLDFQILTPTSSAINIYRAKLELGSVSTLANDPPADFGEELRKCQRYANILDDNAFCVQGVVASSTTVLVFIPLPVTMRIAPSFSNVNIQLFFSNGSVSFGTIGSVSVNKNGISATVTVMNSVTQYTPVIGKMSGQSIISADL